MQKPFIMVLLLTSTAPVCNNWVFLCLSCVLIFLHLYDPNRQPGGWREWTQQGADSPDPQRPVQGLPRYCRPLPAGAASGGQVCRRNCPTLMSLLYAVIWQNSAYLIILFIQIFLQYLLNIKKLVIIVDLFFRQVIKV